MHQQDTALENMVEKEEIARNEQFFRFPPCFLLNQKIVFLFDNIFYIISLFTAELEAHKICIWGTWSTQYFLKTLASSPHNHPKLWERNEASCIDYHHSLERHDGKGWRFKPASPCLTSFNPLPNDKFLDITKLKAFANDKLYEASKESTRPLVLTRKNLVRASGLSFFV